jgi:hypothetical protein
MENSNNAVIFLKKIKIFLFLLFDEIKKEGYKLYFGCEIFIIISLHAFVLSWQIKLRKEKVVGSEEEKRLRKRR